MEQNHTVRRENLVNNQKSPSENQQPQKKNSVQNRNECSVISSDSKNQQKKQTTFVKGRNGEDKACDYLLSEGYEIIMRNYHFAGGEIDAIAIKDDFIIFFEIKTMPRGTPDLLARVLNKRKQQKILKTAKLFLQNHRQYKYEYIRFDVLVIDAPFLDPVHHIVNAFSE